MKRPILFPPNLSMEEYVGFVEDNWRHGDEDMLLRQKNIEERIERMFRMPADKFTKKKITLQPGNARGKPSFPVMRKSRSAERSFAMEMKRLRGMSVEERVLEALGMGDRFSWLAPTRKEDS